MSGLPCNIDAERFVIGSLMLDDTLWPSVAGVLMAEDFSIEKHRRIFKRAGDVQERGERVDRITVAGELMRHGELESCDGLSYLISLDDGLPQIPNIDSYVRLVKDASTLCRIVHAGQAMASRAMEGKEAPEQILASANTSLLDLAQGCAQTTLVTPSDIIGAAGGMEAYLNRRNRTVGISTGYPDLDVMTGGLQKGKLYILAARPAMGKTALAFNIAERVALPAQGDGSTVVAFSLEMAKEELLDRMICSRAGVNTQTFGGGYVAEGSDTEKRLFRAAGEIAADNRIYIDDKANTTEQEIWSKVRKQQARGAVGLVIVDYLQLMLNCKDSERVGAMSRLSRNMKLIAKDCKVPMLVLSQLSRAVETRGSVSNPDGWRPVLSDLRESGSVEQDADVVGALVRMEVYMRDKPELHGQADLELLKQRGGPIGRIPLVWMAGHVRFEQGMAREVSDGEY